MPGKDKTECEARQLLSGQFGGGGGQNLLRRLLIVFIASCVEFRPNLIDVHSAPATRPPPGQFAMSARLR